MPAMGPSKTALQLQTAIAGKPAPTEPQRAGSNDRSQSTHNPVGAGLPAMGPSKQHCNLRPQSLASQLLQDRSVQELTIAPKTRTTL